MWLLCIHKQGDRIYEQSYIKESHLDNLGIHSVCTGSSIQYIKTQDEIPVVEIFCTLTKPTLGVEEGFYTQV